VGENEDSARDGGLLTFEAFRNLFQIVARFEGYLFTVPGTNCQ